MLYRSAYRFSPWYGGIAKTKDTQRIALMFTSPPVAGAVSAIAAVPAAAKYLDKYMPGSDRLGAVLRGSVEQVMARCLVGRGHGTMVAVDRAVSIEDLRRLALRRLPHFVSGYLEGGAGDGGGIRRNVDAFRKYQFIPRGLADVTPVDTGVELFGRKYASLFGISAVGIAGIYRRHADELLAQAARDANIPFILSGASHATIETIGRIAPDHAWYQLYGAHTPQVTEAMLTRARDAGVKVLVYTVD